MRNKYPGICYYCKKPVGVGEGHFERYLGGWRVIHADCVYDLRAEKEAKKHANILQCNDDSICNSRLCCNSIHDNIQ